MLLVHSGVVRIIRKNSSNLWKSTWTPPQVRTTTEILSWFYGRFWSSSWPPCCFLHRQKKDFPNVSCRFSSCSPWSSTPAANHSPAGSSNQPVPSYIYIYIYTSILRWFHPHLFIASQLDFCQLPAWCCLLLSAWPRDIFSSELRLTSCVFLWVSSAQKTSTAIFHSCCALL